VSTPAERKRQLEQACRDIDRSARIAADYAHSRPGRATVEDVEYWERAATAAMERWEEADTTYRVAQHQAGEFPDAAQATHVADLLHQRAILFREVQRCTAHRDECIDLLEAAHKPLPPAGW
jgi:hypothetical protein